MADRRLTKGLAQRRTKAQRCGLRETSEGDTHTNTLGKCTHTNMYVKGQEHLRVIRIVTCKAQQMESVYQIELSVRW